MASDEIQIYPDGDDRWNWRKVEGGETVDEGDFYDSRSDAIAAGRDARGEEPVNITRPDGTVIGQASLGGKLRVVLLRADGSEYGELDPPASENADPNQVNRVTINAVSESSEVAEVEGEVDNG